MKSSLPFSVLYCTGDPKRADASARRELTVQGKDVDLEEVEAIARAVLQLTGSVEANICQESNHLGGVNNSILGVPA